MLTAIPFGYRLAAVLAFIVAIYFVGLIAGREQVQDKWDRAKAIQTQAALTAETAARIKEQSLMTQLAEAQNAATERETKLRADYAAAHATALGLRNTLADLRNGLPTASVAACRQTSATALDVFGECTATVERLAAAADGHASDVKTLTDAWPK
jgi:hypothetical protein